MEDRDERLMRQAIAAAATVRTTTAPNPWVGAALVTDDGRIFTGATQPPGGHHAEIEALRAAGDRAQGSTMYVTLEPCSMHGRTGPCAEALVEAGVRRVVVAIEDPDERVSGRGVSSLREAGIDVAVGLCAADVELQLAPYLKHRTTGRPYVVLKLAATLDGRTAAPDGTSQWITGPEARTDAHRLRAESDAVLVGAGTVRADDPSLTVRHVDAPGGDPLRVVLGHAPAEAKIQPALELSGELDAVLEKLGGMGVLQLLVEGGASVARDFHAAGLVDRYVIYLAPALMGGDDGRGVFAGAGASTINAVWRGQIVAVERLGEDLRVEVVA